MNTAKKKTIKVRTRENDPKYSSTEILTEIWISLNEELWKYLCVKAPEGLDIEQRSK